MAELKDAWKQTAKSFILAINDLGISLAASVKAGVDVAVDWAKKDNPHVEAEGTEIPDPQPVEEPVEAPAEEPAAEAKAEAPTE